MKVLTIKQPWATLLARGIKTDETRSWSTSFRGEFLIHAAKEWDWDSMHIYWAIKKKFNLPDPDEIPTGKIIGKAELTAVMTSEDYKLTNHYIGQEQFGNYEPNRFVFLCQNHVELPTYIPATGKQKFWEHE